MSVSFRVAGRGSCLTLKRIRRLAKENGGEVTEHVDPKERGPGSKLLGLPSGYLHLSRTGKKAWHVFTRYAGNWPAADAWIAILEGQGYTIYDEENDPLYMR